MKPISSFLPCFVNGILRYRAQILYFVREVKIEVCNSLFIQSCKFLLDFHPSLDCYETSVLLSADIKMNLMILIRST